MMAQEKSCLKCGAELPLNAPEGLCPQCLMKAGLQAGSESEKLGPSDDQSAIPTSTTPSRFVPPEPAELAKQFPQLEIIELLGQGGMGAVYKARQTQLDRLVALKILPAEVGQTEAFAERFTREARSLAKLNHPRIVSVYDFGHAEGGLYYFIMEFVDGTDLRHVIQEAKLAPEEALAVVPQICEALQFAHEEGIVHRDIKPENILLDKKGHVRIADFGLAKLLDRPPIAYTLTAAGHRMGTPHYMAPEQIEHPHQVDHRADIFSLGVVFYEMLTGELPIGRFAPPSEKVSVDVRLDKVVLRSLEKEPERRYQHASEVKTDVQAIGSAHMPDVAAGPDPAPGDQEVSLFGIGMGEHVRLVGIIRIVWGCLGLFGALVVLAIFVGPPLISDLAEASLSGLGIPIVALMVMLSGPGIIAGIGLLKRRPWARILALVMAVLDLFAVPVGTAIGIYTIWVLLKAQATQAFARIPTSEKSQQRAEARAQQAPLRRQCSRAAIAGACWAPLALFLLVFFLLSFPGTAGFICLGFLGLTAPFGTTILGLVSITLIRHSVGRLYGMSLALFDALLFPLLALDAPISVLCLLACQSLAAELPLGPTTCALLVSLPVCAVLDILIVRWAWHKANANLPQRC